jgi:hypothetical protein
MRSFIVACVAAIVVAAGGAIVLEQYQKSAQSAYSSTGVRV